MLVTGRLALLAEEATSINQPGSPSGCGCSRGSCAAAMPLRHPQWKTWGQKVRVCLLTGQAPCACTGEGASYKEVLFAPQLKVWTHRAASRSLSGNHRRGVLLMTPTCISASPFSYAELEERLKRIPSGSDVAMPSAKMFEAVEMVEASLSAAREDNEALQIELAEAKSQEESTDARLHEAENEMTQLRGR
ncbi:hypothetical protein CK203_064375 [Vitis vinifera]|uniref:Uncharacterized protein n=1 Tax=Vitis vinifera TaxID=29760 RepID=A0A438G6X2_VITVI|nr:hypothetical protein CK203_064375 [Vitis vinifera]